MAAPALVGELVERFERHRDEYRAASYNEAQLRQDFLNPFFTALGWDVYNQKQYAQAYREVIHEAAVKVGGRTKAPDYCFRVGGGVRSFFVEAKKPAVDIRDAISPAYQLRRYAWSAKLPVSILTDFEELAVYDCRVRPVKTDKAATARILYKQYTDYVADWDELAGLFSPEAIRRGDLDKFISSKRVKKGTAEVDAAFLDEIESWRITLARNIALRNKQLSQRELNFAVQRTIDRVIFLRICEDQAIEPYGKLQALLNGPKVYARLGELFERADERYNSGLFYFTPERGRADPPDELTLALAIDDKPLKEIIRRLYYPDSPYEFSVLPAEILGQVYEQFLGKVIRLTKGHQAKIEDKPEVKKAGGVYYTPKYIVDYIVKQTVGKLLGAEEERSEPEVDVRSDPIHRVESSGSGGGPHECGHYKRGEPPQPAARKQKPATALTPKQAAKLRILDPACGSGSFLIGAYHCLLDWHREWYTADDPEKHARARTPRLYRGPAGDWRLTTAEKKRILLNNIYGVDIDAQAVEVTKLSLLLKVLEGESQETISNQLRLFHERALPDLSSNIKCGNSLIGPDFYEGQQLSLLDDEEVYRVNAFDWQAEFPEVFKGRNPGFGAVIGNPPYIRVSNIAESQRPYLYRRYNLTHRFDIYVAFVQRGFTLLSPMGRLGYIIPNKFITADYGSSLRDFLTSQEAVQRIVDFGDAQVFEGPTTYTCLLFLTREETERLEYTKCRADSQSASMHFGKRVMITTSKLTSAPWTLVDDRTRTLLDRLASFPPLGESCRISHGLQTGFDDVFLLEQVAVPEDERTAVVEVRCKAEENPFPIERAAIRQVVKGAVDVRRYHIEESGRQVLFPYAHHDGLPVLIDEKRCAEQFPLAWEYLQRHAVELRGRKGKNWYAYRRRNYDLAEGIPRLLVPSIGLRASFASDPTGLMHYIGSGGGGGGGYGLTLKDGVKMAMLYFLGLLNSRFLDWQVKLRTSRFGHGYYAYNRQYIEALPIRPIDFSDACDRSRHNRMVELVEQMLSLHKQLASAKTAHAKTVIERQIAATDRQIDRLVYELYELTDEEIAIVEEATRL